MRLRDNPHTRKRDLDRAGQAGWPFDQSWRELAFALAVFMLPAGVILINQSSQARLSFGLLIVASFLGVMSFTGWLGGKPLWSLPYITIILVVAGYLYLFQWVVSSVASSLIDLITPGPWDPSTYLLLKAASHGMLWLMLFCLTLLIVAILAVFNRFRPLLQCASHDWTQLSYILYGESVFALLVLSESRHLAPAHFIAGILVLLAGAWFFLNSSMPSRRILALLGSLTLAVGMLARWTPGVAGSLPGASLLAGGRLLFTWLWMAFALLLPGLLAYRPARRSLISHNLHPGKPS